MVLLAIVISQAGVNTDSNQENLERTLKKKKKKILVY